VSLQRTIVAGLKSPTAISAGLLVALYAAASVVYAEQGFGTVGNLLNILDSYAVLGVIAVGMTGVIISGGIDLSVGAVMALSSVVAAVLLRTGWTLPLAIGIPVLGAAALGALQGVFIHRTGLAPFIVTLATMFLARGLGFLVSLEPVAIAHEGHAQLAMTHVAIGESRLRAGAMVFLVSVLVGAYTLRQTRFGRSVYALGGSEEASRLMGLRVGATRVGVYTLSAMCAGIAGILLTFQISSGSHLEGFGLELDAIAAVVIGGTLLRGGAGSVLGTLVGVLLIGVVVTLVTTFGAGTSSGLSKLLIAGLLLAFVVIQRVLALTRERAGSRPG
jgi:ribose/xylose/arabinose/galactoside ABC-type transport system permease subunit